MIYYPVFIPPQETQEFGTKDLTITLYFEPINETYTSLDTGESILGGVLIICDSQKFDQFDNPVILFSKPLDYEDLMLGNVEVSPIELPEGDPNTQYMWSVLLNVQLSDDINNKQENIPSINLDNRYYNYFTYNSTFENPNLMECSEMYPLIYTDQLSFLGQPEKYIGDTYHTHCIPHVITEYRELTYVNRSMSLFNVSFITYPKDEDILDIAFKNITSTVPVEFILYNVSDMPKIKLLKNEWLLTAYTRFDNKCCISLLVGTNYKSEIIQHELDLIGVHGLVDIVRISDTEAIVFYITDKNTCKYYFVTTSGTTSAPVLTVSPLKTMVFETQPRFFGWTTYHSDRPEPSIVVNNITVSNGETNQDALLFIYRIVGSTVYSAYSIDYTNKSISPYPESTKLKAAPVELMPLSIFQYDNNIYTSWVTNTPSDIRPVIILLHSNLEDMTATSKISIVTELTSKQLIYFTCPISNSIFYEYSGTIFYFYNGYRYIVFPTELKCFKLPKYFETENTDCHENYQMMIPYNHTIMIYMYWKRNDIKSKYMPNILGRRQAMYTFPLAIP